jgi:hypothetical protein
MIGNDSQDAGTAKKIAKFDEGGDISFYDDTGTSQALFWDASAESLGIGTTSPAAKLDVNGDYQGAGNIITSSGFIRSPDGSAGTPSIQPGVDADTGFFRPTTNNIGFSTAGLEAMRIDANQNLLVGTTSAYSTTGTTINAAGLVYSSADGDRAGQFDRTTSDGELVRFSKAGTTVGSISTGNSGNLYIGSGDAGINFNAVVNSIYPINAANGGGSDGVLDLGLSGAYRFKDLHLSGGAYLGGTAAANKLDDYEEGTWTPSYVFDVGGGSVVYGSQGGTYVKIGQTVYVSFLLQVTSGLSASDYFLRLTGLPFSGSNISQQRGRVWIQNPSSASFNLSVEGGTTSLLFYATNADADYARGDDVNGVRISGAFTYRTS